MPIDVEKLPKKLYDRALDLNITKITLNFSGGSDEGYLNVNFDVDGNWNDKLSELSSDIEVWAWDVYSYGGAGDGSDFGDDIEYDLVNKKVSTSEWYTSRVDGGSEGGQLEIDETSEIDESVK